MRRAAYILVGAAAGAVALAAAWWWWTAPPVSDAAAPRRRGRGRPGGRRRARGRRPAGSRRPLAAPPTAGRCAARGRRAGRAIGACAAQAVVATLGGESRGPLTVWWRGDGMAAAAEVSDGSAHALRMLAALEDLSVRTAPAAPGTVTVAIASDAALLDGPAGGRPQPAGSDRLAGLARVGARWWYLQAARDRLDLVAGTAPELPPRPGPSIVVTADLGRLAGPASLSRALPHVPLGLSFGTAGWALALPGVTPGPRSGSCWPSAATRRPPRPPGCDAGGACSASSGSGQGRSSRSPPVRRCWQRCPHPRTRASWAWCGEESSRPRACAPRTLSTRCSSWGRAGPRSGAPHRRLQRCGWRAGASCRAGGRSGSSGSIVRCPA